MDERDNKRFLNEQIITYIGNKRKLLSHIEKEVKTIKKVLEKEKISVVDLFSGSGIVARMMKKHAYKLIANDLEKYSYIINNCYLSNKSDFDENEYNKYYRVIQSKVEKERIRGIISENYAPLDDNNIILGERAFYTRKNAETIDTIRFAINEVPESMRKYFLGPLLYSASVHNNTGGVFKGFYKDSNTGIGRFGGNGENALKRIKNDIELLKPIFSSFECEFEVLQEDGNQLVKKLDPADIMYIDPPYNQHPYGSNYFMLNVILENKLGGDISKVSGIPKDWNRSDYNKKGRALSAFEDLIIHANAKFLIVSYNSEGFIQLNEIEDILRRHGNLKVHKIKYNTYRASRNLNCRDLYVNEYIFILDKRMV